MRKDSDARDQEFMVDGAGCAGYGVHKFCCPPDQTPPTCGWYHHNNGNCENNCPSGTVEIGSNSAYCGVGPYEVSLYQAACCTTDTPSMQLYKQCDWTAWPACGAESCSSGLETIANSTSGSGDAQCWGDGERKYCCHNNDATSRWSDCDWYFYQTFGEERHSSDFCYSGCPADMIRVAMDHAGCPDGSAWARCCKPDFRSVTKRQDNETDMYERYLDIFLRDPTCPDGGIYDGGGMFAAKFGN